MSLVFWEKWEYQKVHLKLTDLYHTKTVSLYQTIDKKRHSVRISFYLKHVSVKLITLLLRFTFFFQIGSSKGSWYLYCWGIHWYEMLLWLVQAMVTKISYPIKVRPCLYLKILTIKFTRQIYLYFLWFVIFNDQIFQCFSW